MPVKHQSGLASKPEWGSFHDVQLRGFNVDRELVCVADYGDIPESQTRKREVQCDRFPSILVLAAEESPCENGTMTEYLVYMADYDGTFVWNHELRGCNEEIPPELEETPVTPTKAPEPTETPKSTSTQTAVNVTSTDQTETRTETPWSRSTDE